MSEIDHPEQNTLDPKLKSLLSNSETEDKNYIYCATCSNVITTVTSKIEINDSHEHYCVNPHGFEFRLGCFSEALGCSISGEPQAADSWFMHHTWRIAACSECSGHLGWYFAHAQTEQYFYGLILANIQEESSN